MRASSSHDNTITSEDVDEHGLLQPSLDPAFFAIFRTESIKISDGYERPHHCLHYLFQQCRIQDPAKPTCHTTAGLRTWNWRRTIGLYAGSFTKAEHKHRLPCSELLLGRPQRCPVHHLQWLGISDHTKSPRCPSVASFKRPIQVDMGGCHLHQPARQR